MSNSESPRPFAWPAGCECDVVLRDGSTIHLRRAKHDDDAPLIAEFYDHLSDESFYRRFLSVRSAQRRRDKPKDAIDRFVLLAELRERVGAVAELAVMPGDTSCAEVALAISDELQGKGVGSRMLEILAELARSAGIDRFVSLVLGTNRRMMQVFQDSGFAVKQRLEENVYEVTLSLEPSSSFQAQLAAREQVAAAASMHQFFAPKTIAVIGASRNPNQIGAKVLQNLGAAGFRGRIYPVNPKATRIDASRCFASVTEIDAPVDLAIVAVAAKHVPAVVDECLAKHVPGIIVISAGFSELGNEGRALENVLVRKVRAAGARMIGPNCMGIINTDPATRLNATFARNYPAAGNVAFASQSGALGLSILDHAKRLHLGISTFVSMGNKADVSGNDLIQYWACDPRTDVILLYLESFGNPRTFGRLARHVAREKPIVAVKAGRSAAGARAASSHTGALASSDAVVDGLFRQAGIIRTSSVTELFDVASLLSRQALPKGPHVAILTNAGGPGILAADACEAAGLELPELSLETVTTLRTVLPAEASVANPVDMLAAATPEQYRASMAALSADERVDSLVVIYTPPFISSPTEIARAIADGASRCPNKPVVTVFMDAEGPPASLGQLPCYAFPEPAIAALAHVAEYAKWRTRPASETPRFADIDRGRLRAVVDACLARGGGWLTAAEGQALMEAARIPTSRTILAEDEESTLRAAREIGFPVALKASGPSILHKSDVGGVLLSLTNEDELRAAYFELAGRLGARMTGVVVQEMAGTGVEMMIGALQDATFGPVLAYGSGGTLLELMSDVSFRLQPLTRADAADMMNEIRGAALLKGYRGSPPADEGAVCEALLRISSLIELFPELQELDLNPIVVSQYGVKAIDVRVRIEPLRAPIPSSRIRY